MEAIKKRMNALRVEADESSAKVEELQSRVKALEQENLAKEQEITSLSHKNQILETEVEKLEVGIKEAKAAADESSQHGTQNESLQRKLQMLEDEAEQADKNLRETNEKYAFRMFSAFVSRSGFVWLDADFYHSRRLRQTDVKAGHYERKVQALESAQNNWETKYEEMAKKYADTKKELDDFVAEIGNI
ncbi:tropomyosin-2 [Cryomyces antarcticus]|nr:tropomyosin-2 [Cryomyces antarcticus]